MPRVHKRGLAEPHAEPAAEMATTQPEDEGEEMRTDRSSPEDTVAQPSKRRKHRRAAPAETEENFATQAIEETAASDGDDDDGTDHYEEDNLSGKVKLIELTDFMCHERLNVTLNPQINFITGPNGSGKSAIIAALQTCLGMKAQQTGRGKNFRELIREGCDRDAIVRVTLYNQGANAYAPERFGSSIIIERTLKQNGTTPFRLLNGDTKALVTKDRKDLDLIVAHFNIMVHNPCCILDQNSSKTFLRGSNQSKYNVFLSGTMLDTMMDMYANEKKLREQTKALLEDQKDERRRLKHEWKEADARVSQLKKLSELSNKKTHLERQSAWAIYANMQATADARLAEVQQFELGLQQKMNEIQARKEALQSFDGREQGLHDQTIKLNDELARLRQERDMIQSQLGSVQNQQRELAMQYAQVNNQLNNETRMRDLISQERDSLAQRFLQQDMQAKAAEESRQQQIRALQAEQDQLENQRRADGEQMDSADGMIRDLEKRSKDAYRDSEGAKREARNAAEELARLKETQRDASALYGQDVARMVRAIEDSDGLFTRKPVHVGLHLRLRDTSWASPVEFALKNSLDLFVVDNNRDAKALTQMFAEQRIRRRNIHVSRFTDRMYDLSTVQPDLEHSSIKATRFLDVLEVSNPEAFNALVDRDQIQKLVLVREQQLAEAFAYSQSRGRGRSVPRRDIKCVFDVECNKYMHRNGSEFTQRYRGKDSKFTSRFLAGAGGEISQEAIDEAHAVVNEREREAKQTARELEAARRDEKDAKRKLAELKNKQQSADRRFGDIAYELNRLNDMTIEVNSMSKVDLERERCNQRIDECNSRIATLQQSLQQLQASQAEHQAAIQPLAAESARLEGQVQHAKQAQAALQPAVQQLMVEKRSALSEIQYLESRVANATSNGQAARNDLEILMNKANEAKQGALEFCNDEEVDTEGQTLEQIRKKIKSTTAQIEREYQNHIANGSKNQDAEVVIREAELTAARAKERYDKVEKSYRTAKDNIRHFKEANFLREKGWEDLRDNCKTKMGNLFRNLLAQYNHSGEVIFDDEQGTINFSWSKNNREGRADSATDAGTLSGGESSLTMLSFLVAMGSLVDCPFRVMDEFDVFMDETNRNVSMHTLIKMARARASLSKQFIFITPHDISAIPDGPDIHKLRMAPRDYSSRSNQTVLPFGGGQ